MASNDVETIRQAHEAWNIGDIAALRPFYAEDLSADAGPMWPSAGLMHGRDAVFAQFASIFETFDHVVVVPEEFIECEDHVVVVPTIWRGTLPGSTQVVEQRLAAVYRMRGGRIGHIDFVADIEQALASAPPRKPVREPEPQRGG